MHRMALLHLQSQANNSSAKKSCEVSLELALPVVSKSYGQVIAEAGTLKSDQPSKVEKNKQENHHIPLRLRLNILGHRKHF